MHPSLKRFIENGERELEGLEEPERSIKAAKLHNDLLRRFKPEMFEGDEEFDGNLIEDEPITAKDVEENIIQGHYDSEENKNASDFAEEGCYSYDDSEREPRLPKLQHNPRIEHASASQLKTYNKQLPGERMRSVEYGAGLEFVNDPTPITQRDCDDDESNFLDGLHDVTSCQRKLTAFSAASDAPEGDSRVDHYNDKHAEYKPTRPYHDRVAGVMGRNAENAHTRMLKRTIGWGNSLPNCEHCGEGFDGRKGQKYCSTNCRKRAHESAKIVSR